MTNNEAELAFKELHQLVSESPLSWILPNVDEEIQRGKPGTRTLERSGSSEMYVEPKTAGNPKRSQVKEFTTVTPFNATEKLELLISSVVRVLNEIPKLQTAAINDLSSYGGKDVLFADEASDSRTVLAPARGLDEVATQLNPLLSQLRN